MAVTAIAGARYAYVVMPLEGTVERPVVEWVPNKPGKDGKVRGGRMERRMKTQPAGFMVYFPRGHTRRFRDEAELRQYKLHKKPKIINMTGLMDPNSPIGKMFSGQEEERQNGADELDKMTCRLATAKSGSTLLPEQTDKGLSLDDFDISQED